MRIGDRSCTHTPCDPARNIDDATRRAIVQARWFRVRFYVVFPEAFCACFATCETPCSHTFSLITFPFPFEFKKKYRDLQARANVSQFLLQQSGDCIRTQPTASVTLDINRMPR